MKSVVRALTLIFAAAGLAACGLFGDDDELKPAELLDFDPKVRVKKIWSMKVGGDAEFLRVALRPASDGNRIYAASVDGDVYALDPKTGKSIWRTRLDEPLSAGPGVGGKLLAVVTADGYAIALDADSGNLRWRSDVRGESLATPAITANAVIVQTVDNRLRALEAFDGRERWVLLQSMPRLTMRGTTSPVVAGSTVISGFDNGRLVAVDLDTGDVEWEVLLAPPTGRSDLERLSDVDGAIAVVGQDVFAAGYQGRIVSVAAESGQILWATEISSHRGVSADWSSLYTVQDGGELIALSRRNGAESWRTAALLRREPTLPVPYATTVAAGDFEGYLHFFTNLDGTPAARVKVDGSAITNDPLVAGDALYVQTDGGTVAAFRIEQPQRRAPDIADTAEEGA